MYLFAALCGWAYAAVRDAQVRQVPNYVFGLLLLVGGLRAFTQDLVFSAILSASVMIPLSLYAYNQFDFGGADAKALITASVVYPESVFVFLFGMAGTLFYYRNDSEIPMLMPCFVGAVVTTAYLVVV